MAKIIKDGESSHWYLPDGSPMHQVAMKKPNAKGETMRNTNIGDARKLGLLPSVTNILAMLDKPQLTDWKIEQAIKACMRLRQRDDESPEEFIKRAFEESKKPTKKAAGFGIDMHRHAEKYAFDQSYRPDDPSDEPYFGYFTEWFDENVEEVFYVEKVIVGGGFAGTQDMKARIRGIGVATTDFKTRKSFPSPTKKEPDRRQVRVYDGDGMQLGAYRDADTVMCAQNKTPPPVACVSVLIDSIEPGPPFIHVWDEDELRRLSNAFHHLVGVWQSMKDYAPE